MPARVAVRVGINADEKEVADGKARLFAQLPAARLFDGLADIHEAARQRITALERLIPTANEQNAPARIENHTIDGQRWCCRETHQIYVRISPEWRRYGNCGRDQPLERPSRPERSEE
jgi:hypothetical protein